MDDDRLGAAGRCSATPLLFLLDGVLSQDEDRVDEAVEEIRSMGCRTPEESPCTSKSALCSILSSLLSSYPELASMRSNHDGSLPLHFAASLGYVPAAALLLTKFPPAATMPNEKGKIPLHYAAREGRLDMVNYFLRTVPQTAAIATEKGKLALHFAAGEGHQAISSALLWHYPQSARLPSAKGKLPLHFCARWGYVTIAHELLRVYPDAVRALDWEGSLPLHDAAREGQVRMSRFLVERFPAALQICNLRGEIPLFPAARSGCVELVVLMLQAWPMGGKQVLRNVGEDDTIATWNWDIVDLLLRAPVNRLSSSTLVEGLEPPSMVMHDDVKDANAREGKEEHRKSKKAKKQKPAKGMETQMPRLAPVPDPFSLGSPTSPAGNTDLISQSPRCKSPALGFDDTESKSDRRRKRSPSISAALSPPTGPYVPLLAALQVKATYQVLRHVLNQRPGDVDIMDGRGRFALHWAASMHTTDDCVVDLVSEQLVTLRAAGTRDETGQLPLHLAIGARADTRLVEQLLHIYPAGGVERCRARGKFYNMSPIGMAITMDSDLSTIFQLLRVDPTCVKTRSICKPAAKQHVNATKGQAAS